MGLYDYGARYYDPAVARWGQVDPLAEKFASESPYNYVGNDPIRNIDVGGKYKLPAEFIQKYPNLSRYLQENVRNDVMNSSVILSALSRNTAADSPNGIGNLTSSEVDKAVTYDSGPNLTTSDAPGGVESANGFYDPGTNTISLKTENVDALESILASDASTEDKQKALFKVYSTILHETTHYGDYLDGLRQDGGEPGFDFEREVWGIRWEGFNEETDTPAIRFYENEKYQNNDLIDEMFNFLNSSEKMKATLPTVPNKN